MLGQMAGQMLGRMLGRMLERVPCSRGFVAGLLVILASVGGCSSQRGPEIVEVSGIVTRDGQPVPDLFLNFLPEDHRYGRPSSAMTDANGRFRLEYGRDPKYGAQVGQHTVFVTNKSRPSNPLEEDNLITGRTKKAKTAIDYQAIFAKYSRESTPLKHFEITEATDDLHLKLD